MGANQQLANQGFVPNDLFRDLLGLGLAITQALVHKLGGQIWLESQPGQGAMFCVWLPLAPDSGLANAAQ